MPAARDAIAAALCAAIVVSCDQLTKAMVVGAIGPGSGVSRIDAGVEWIALEYAENRGAAFGLFSNLTPLLALLSAAILIGVLVHFLRTPNWTPIGVVSVGAIAGGALGNLIDRVRLGYVVDFVAVGPWPNFNLADSAITLGVLGLLWTWMQPEGAG